MNYTNLFLSILQKKLVIFLENCSDIKIIDKFGPDGLSSVNKKSYL